jgi:uncharacterized protein YvpB
VTPTLRLLAVTFADRSRQPSGPKVDGAAGRGRDLDVPGLSQVEQDPSIAYEICSPTSLTMVMRFWGVKRAVMETVRGVRDSAAGMYGNWSLNAAFAGSQGLESYVDRFYSIEQLEASIAAGRPIVASVLWRIGELDNAPSPSATTGHLIVVRGFTQGGDVVVNDPLGTGAGIRRVYRRDQFTKIWLGQGGVVYVVGPRA